MTMMTETRKAQLNVLAKRAAEKYPYNVARITRAVEIILDGGVELRHDGSAIVTNHHHIYAVNGSCPCVDFQQGNAPDNMCKHRWAKCLSARMEKEALASDVWTDQDYIATATDRHGNTHNGIARLLGENGLRRFHPYAPDGVVMRDYADLPAHQVCLGPLVLAVVAQYGPIEWAAE
jgi:hypothetical protein